VPHNAVSARPASLSVAMWPVVARRRLFVIALLPLLTATLLVREKAGKKATSVSLAKPLEAYVIAKQDAGVKDRLTQSLNNSFSSLTFSDPVYVGAADITRLLNDGAIDANYRSWYVGGGGGPTYDANNVMANAKFPHELGCTLAHRKVWKEVVSRFDSGKSAPWAAVFEADVIMREDFWQRATALRSQLSSSKADIIMMGHCFEACPSSFKGDDMNLGGNVHVVDSNHPVCTHAYLVSAAGAKRLLGLTVPMKMAVDERIRALSAKGKLDALSTCPMIARQPWQQQAEMFNFQVSGSLEFTERGGNATQFPQFMSHVMNLQL